MRRRAPGKSYIFAIGAIGFDFGTEARRDSFRQLMPRHRIGERTTRDGAAESLRRLPAGRLPG